MKGHAALSPPPRRCSPLRLLAGLAAACGPAPAARWVHPTALQWHAARCALEKLRAAAPRAPYVATVTTTLREARSGRTFDARGAVAVAPGRAVRMILVGAAGTTVLDAWITRGRWRVAVPPLDRVRRGGAENPGGLPVGFLRWWFVSQFDGTLFAASAGPGGDLWLLRDGDAVVDLRVAPGGAGTRVTAIRRVPEHVERIDESGSGPSPLAPAPGDSVAYVDETSGLRVTLAVESIGSAPPDPAAFRDPDSGGAAPVPSGGGSTGGVEPVEGGT